MRENEFRDRLHNALGEPPPMAPPRLGARNAIVRRGSPRAMAAIAIGLAIVLVAVLVASRVSLRQTWFTEPGGRPVSVGLAPDSFPCALAVAQISEAGNPGGASSTTRNLGFVNVPSGEFWVDSKANVANLPHIGSIPPALYSAELKRWIPATTRTISPDGRAYAYVRKLPADAAAFTQLMSTELHVYDVGKKVDRKVWSQPLAIEVIRWDATGVVVSTLPFRGGVMNFWRVDPASGSAVPAPQDVDPGRLPLTILPPGGGSYSYLGSDAQGHSLFRIGSRDRGTRYSVIVARPAGTFMTLYEGTAGDAKDFDPQGVSSDAHGMWIGNFDGSRLWLWSETPGLRDFKITGGPASPAGYQYTSSTFLPAGPCVPGVFKGVAPATLPAAPTPSPSPVPPIVDWSTLTSKPLQLDQLPAGATCPISMSKDIPVKGQSGKWPNYGFGNGPAYLSGQFYWYSNGGQGALILVDPQYQGPLLVRSKRLDGAGSLTFGGEGLANVGDGTYGLAQTGSPPYWGTWFGFLTTDAPGCYGIQLDGTNFSAVVVISVKKGPPPPA